MVKGKLKNRKISSTHLEANVSKKIYWKIAIITSQMTAGKPKKRQREANAPWNM